MLAADTGKVCHANVFLAEFVDDRHARDPRFIVGKAPAQEFEEASIDLVDDLEVTRKQRTEHGQGPAFESLGQDGVVGVVEGVRGDLPGLVPAQAVDVDQETHQFGDADGGMSVVELDRAALMKDLDGVTVEEVAADHVLQGAGGEEVLLLQAKLFAVDVFVVGIEDLGDVFGEDFGTVRHPV